MRFPMLSLKKHKVGLLLILALPVVQSVTAAYLPALRAKPLPRLKRNINDDQPATSLAPLGHSRREVLDHADDKRVLASRLLRKAASNKRHSLRDVLARPPKRSTASSSQNSSQSNRDIHSLKRSSLRQNVRPDHDDHDTRRMQSQQTDILHTIAAHLFPSQPNSTSHSSPFYPSLSLYVQLDDSPSSASTSSSSSFITSEYSHSARKDHFSSGDTIRTNSHGTFQKSASDNTTPGGDTSSSVRDGKQENKDVRRTKSSKKMKSPKANSRMSDDFPRHATMSAEAEMEAHLLQRSIAALNTTSASEATAALRVLQELCHSIHNGRALETSGGIERVLEVLASRHRRVRATALWAVATCCQNNPPVQRAALRNGAVQTLAKIAWKDVLTVRARALFALNALLGMEEARETFEKLPYATHVVIAALRDRRDFRATRRALNLIELLVGRNLDAWKTQLEAWDIPAIIERLMREHSDVDVRESAARIIAALDGKIVG